MSARKTTFEHFYTPYMVSVSFTLTLSCRARRREYHQCGTTAPTERDAGDGLESGAFSGGAIFKSRATRNAVFFFLATTEQQDLNICSVALRRMIMKY